MSQNIEDADQNLDMDPEYDSAVETRLIGAEDIYWDENGIDEINSFVDRTGTEHRISGINSGKIPLQQMVMGQLPGANNVTDALLKLAERTGSQSSHSILDKDVTVVLGADLTHEQKQAIIDAQIRNLGGHVLTVQFPESLDLAISFIFSFSGFHNGKLVIDLNGIELSDVVILTCLILIQDCSCHIEVTGGRLKHTLSYYAIKAIRCPHLYLNDLQFTGSGTNNSYALYAEDSDGYAEDCVFSEDNPVLAEGFLATAPVAAHDSSVNPHSGVLAKLASPAFSGTPTAPNPESTSNDTTIATTSFVQSVANGVAGEALSVHDSSENPHSGVLAKLASPAFSGTPTAPNPESTSNDTTIATTSFVQSVANGVAGEALSVHDSSVNPHSGVLVKLDSFNTHQSDDMAHRKLVPAGVVFPFAGAGNIPDGFLLCNGQTVSRSTYSDLFAAIGTTYGAGDGSTTFKVPDFRGQFLRGYLNGTTSAIGVKQNEGLPDIKLITRKTGGPGGGSERFVLGFAAENYNSASTDFPVERTSLSHSNNTSGPITPHGIYGKSNHVTPTNFAIQWIIKY